MSAGDKGTVDAQWEGVRKAALSNAIRERIHTLVDELQPLGNVADNSKSAAEIIALLEQFPVMGAIR